MQFAAGRGRAAPALPARLLRAQHRNGVGDAAPSCGVCSSRRCAVMEIVLGGRRAQLAAADGTAGLEAAGNERPQATLRAPFFPTTFPFAIAAFSRERPGLSPAPLSAPLPPFRSPTWGEKGHFRAGTRCESARDDGRRQPSGQKLRSGVGSTRDGRSVPVPPLPSPPRAPRRRTHPCSRG